MGNTECELSIVMPYLDEAETLAVCIDKARFSPKMFQSAIKSTLREC